MVNINFTGKKWNLAQTINNENFKLLMNKEIKYIGFYDLPIMKNKRTSTIAAINKMDYICTAINSAGFDVHVVSPSWFDDSTNNINYTSQKTIQLNNQKKITFCPSFNTRSKWKMNLKIVFTLIWLFFWLLLHTRKNEKILVYHVQWLSLPIRWAKKIMGFKLILEVEEIYGQVWNNKAILQKWEQKLIRDADYFIAVSDILAEILGSRVKAIIYGSYSIPILDAITCNINEINVVYAGSIESTRGGAINAVKCAEFLPKEYIIHILGSGNIEIVNILIEEINRINIKLERIACIFHGLKTGNEFDELMSNCTIGINPQFEGNYMNTAFPSKIIKYLSYNLRVISARIKSIEKSEIAPLIVFPENDMPESMAMAILKLDLNSKYDSKDILRQLDKKFVATIKTLLKNDKYIVLG